MVNRMINVSESALESIKKMAEDVQKDRDMLKNALLMIKSNNACPITVWKLANDAISAMQAK